ncbi:MAG: hypothetical protein SGILL_006593 [Bacillariaceae sp.]
MVDYVDLGLCALDCRAVDEGEDDETYAESLTMMSSIRQPRRKAQSLASAVNEEIHEPSKRKAILMERLEKFQTKGWLSEQEHRKFRTFLSTFDSTSKIGESGAYALKEMEVELNLMETRMQGKQSAWKKATTTPTKGGRASPSFSVFSKNSNNKSSRGFSNKSPKAPLGNLTNRFSNGGNGSKATTPVNNGSIVSPASLSTSLSDEGIATLFAEMSFFARLGFVQPPCCMECTYRESMQQAVPRLDCKRWVIWRRNANITLNPSNIGENTIAVQCHSARKLTAGNAVESYKWDRTKKIMVETSRRRAWV